MRLTYLEAVSSEINYGRNFEKLRQKQVQIALEHLVQRREGNMEMYCCIEGRSSIRGLANKLLASINGLQKMCEQRYCDVDAPWPKTTAEKMLGNVVSTVQPSEQQNSFSFVEENAIDRP